MDKQGCLVAHEKLSFLRHMLFTGWRQHVSEVKGVKPATFNCVSGADCVLTCWWLYCKCAVTTFYTTIIWRELWCTVKAVTACHQQIWHRIHRDVSEISIVSSWPLTVVFHCEYQPRCWWISPFSSNLVTNSYRPLWCQRQSVNSCSHVSVSAVEHTVDCWTERLAVNLMIQWIVVVVDEWIVTEHAVRSSRRVEWVSFDETFSVALGF